MSSRLIRFITGQDKSEHVRADDGSMDNRQLKHSFFGVILGVISWLAVAYFKGSSLVSTAFGCLLSAIACAWGFTALVKKRDRRQTVCCLIPAILFAGFCLVGFSFALNSTPERLYGAPELILKTCGAFAGYTVVFFLMLCGLFHWLKQRKTKTYTVHAVNPRGYAALLLKRPFTTAFVTMLAAYLPYIAASYPALFMGDCQTILPQGFGIAVLTTHHPVPYTLFVTGVIRLGLSVFHSWNAGAFLFSVLQLLFFLAVMAYAIRILIRELELNWKWAVMLEAWFVLGPRVSNCMFVMTKDVYYAAFLLLLAVALVLVFRQGWTTRSATLLILSSVGILAFRKDGFYVLMISYAVFLLFSKPLRKKMPLFLIGVLALHLLFNQVIYPAAGIPKGSIKEMLSIPMQQTARCAKYLGDSLTEEEKSEILDMFTFESIEEMGAAYDPSLVDYVKFRFPEQVDSELLHRYLRLWAAMGKRYPATYVNAFINNYFEYVYPGCVFMQCSYDWSETCFGRVNTKMGSDFHYPEGLAQYRHGLESLREKIFETWPFRLLNMPGMTTWFLLVWAFWLIWQKDDISLMLTVPLFVVMLICIASPCNGYYCRYQYPLLPYMPWAILAGRQLRDSLTESVEENDQ